MSDEGEDFMKEAKAEEAVIQTSKYYSFKFEEDHLLEVKRCFDLYDGDYDGILDTEEIGNVVRSFCFFDPDNFREEVMPVLFTEKDIRELKKNMDPQQTGKV